MYSLTDYENNGYSVGRHPSALDPDPAAYRRGKDDDEFAAFCTGFAEGWAFAVAMGWKPKMYIIQKNLKETLF